jgi:EAL domain-containing protein (putative c-di-GMP-specific phosphodiesterase class I)
LTQKFKSARARIAAGVASDGVDIYFQPIVAVGTRRIGFEALARWQSAVLGAI